MTTLSKNARIAGALYISTFMLNSLPYQATACTGFFWPHYEAAVWDALFPLGLGEVAMMLWLLIIGAREKSLAAGA